MWWWQRKDILYDYLVSVLRDEVAMFRHRHELDCERIDRLMEALARRGGVDLIMPSPPLPEQERVDLPNPWKDPNPVTSKFKNLGNKEKTQ